MERKETFEEFRERLDAGAAEHEGRDPRADLYEVEQKKGDAAERMAREVSYVHSLSEFMDTTKNALAGERGKHQDLQSHEMIAFLGDLLNDLEARRAEAEQRMENATAETEELNKKIEELNRKVSGTA